ncbi:hypothetical protein [Cyclobacterium salsum]|uniref:hypothetical protein n=1 Tax=Cyclobacterium salsum TaxID=2666329 RepID=UPI001390EEB8|nr:hypothetical protein [Cyclobacterium salsum]
MQRAETPKSTLKYGRNPYDFEEGSMVFVAPNQVISSDSTGFSVIEDDYTIILHADFVIA